MSDKYDDAIKYLTDHPGEIKQAWWGFDGGHRAGCLFDIVPGCGACLTEVKAGLGDESPFARRIRDDDRIPVGMDSITVDMLPVFAEYQREFDETR